MSGMLKASGSKLVRRKACTRGEVKKKVVIDAKSRVHTERFVLRRRRRGRMS